MEKGTRVKIINIDLLSNFQPEWLGESAVVMSRDVLDGEVVYIIEIHNNFIRICFDENIEVDKNYYREEALKKLL